MTLLELMRHTLLQLGEDFDELEEFEALIRQYINEAYFDLCRNIYKPQLLETLTLKAGRAALSELSMSCCGVERVEKDGVQIPFSADGDTLKTNSDGDVTVRYRFVPLALSDYTDTPVLPEDCHSALADFATARVLGSGSRSRQTRANFFLQRYYEVRGRLQPMFKTSKFINRY